MSKRRPNKTTSFLFNTLLKKYGLCYNIYYFRKTESGFMNSKNKKRTISGSFAMQATILAAASVISKVIGIMERHRLYMDMSGRLQYLVFRLRYPS